MTAPVPMSPQVVACGIPVDLPYFLSQAEARRHGVDVGGAIHSGILTLEDFRALLASCQLCRDGEGRSHHSDAAEVPETPPFCANKAVLDGLRGLV